MNILIDLAPKSVVIGSKEYEINSNFRTSILFEQMIQDTTLNEFDKIKHTILLYYNEIPDDLQEAIDKAMWFYRGGKDLNKKTNSDGSSEQLYDWDYDDELIYSAFLSQYNIDLQDIEYLHWWKFRALFNSLNKSNKISEVMEIRSIKLSDIKDKEQRKQYQKLKNLYSIPKKKDLIELEDELSQILMTGGDINNFINNNI